MGECERASRRSGDVALADSGAHETAPGKGALPMQRPGCMPAQTGPCERLNRGRRWRACAALTIQIVARHSRGVAGAGERSVGKALAGIVIRPGPPNT